MFLKFAFLLLFLLTHTSACFAQQPDPNSPRIKLVESFQGLLEQADDNIESKARSILAKDNFEALHSAVIAARRFTKEHDVSEIILENQTTGRFEFESIGRVTIVNFGISSKEPFRIERISVSDGKDSGDGAAPLTWENLETSMDRAADDGFEGVVLVIRNGEVAFSKAYGFANRENKIKNRVDTIFAVGSAPIDFTHAAILLLKDMGKLNLDDPLTKFFKNVPDDKQNITIRQLMKGRSGFHNFHDLPNDENVDHTWIDRDEAVERIFAQKLLFEPGTDSRHSHSAWGLLAAIVEISSGESYAQFATNRLFKPAGMNHTGFFGEPVPEDRIAVGYGFKKSSDPNSPPHWGKTSWLVMGSGGQTSTLGDMYRWVVAMNSGEILSPESTRKYVGTGDPIHANGDMFGFEFVHSSNPDQLFMIISNTVSTSEDRKKFGKLWRNLHQLVKRTTAKYLLGIMMGVTDEGIVIQQIVPGSAAEKDGLKVGDELVAANEHPLVGDPTATLSPMLTDGSPIEFKVLRNHKTLLIRVTPLPIKGDEKK